MRSKTFTYDGRSFEVRAAVIDQRHTVRVFENGKPVGRVEYGATLEVAQDAYPWDVVAELMDAAEADFIRWSDWQKAQPGR